VKFTGDATLNAPVDRVWQALLDPAVLVRIIPGCERLESTGENAYAMTVTAGVAAIRGTYDGTCALSDLKEHESLVMHLQGAGAPGTIGATVNVGFAAAGDGATRVSYDADAIVGGMVGGVGQRMLGSVSKRMAGEFFDNVASAIGSGPVAAPAASAAASQSAPATSGEVGQVFTAPPRAGSSQQEFLTGIAVGAGLVLLGVIAGGLFGRRRR
jgi:uncharacterized protein